MKTRLKPLTVHSALERCVDYIGRVDIDFICALARVDKAEAFQSLKGAIYYDPEKSCFVTAEEYLSGNIMKKLAAAKSALEQQAETAKTAGMNLIPENKCRMIGIFRKISLRLRL